MAERLYVGAAQMKQAKGYLVGLLAALILLQHSESAAAKALVTRQQRLAATPRRTHYTAGVVEFRPGTMESNLAAYLEIINSTPAAPTDILVFPEATLSMNAQATFVPNPVAEGLVAPCIADAQALYYHELLVQLSCAARATATYVVVNLAEKTACPDDATDPRPCAEDGLNIYNTNVVFDREGRVISRYRKINLYGEPKNVTWQPALGLFETDFGVTFGHFVCFDILFYMPAQELVEKHGVHDFIYTSMWFSQLPFLTGVQFQHAWAWGNDVNVLAAGASSPPVGNTGSGIYQGRRNPLVAVVNSGLGERQLYVAELPIYGAAAESAAERTATAGRSSPLAEAHAQRNELAVGTARSDVPFPNLKLKRDYLERYESVWLDLSQGTSKTLDLCYNNTFCCHFELQWRRLNASAESTYYAYRLAAFDGWRKDDGAEENWLKNCALFTCTAADDIMQCGKLFDSDLTVPLEPQYAFERVSIQATFPRSDKYLLMPNTLLDTLLPLPVQSFVWEEVKQELDHTVHLQLNASTSNVLTLAIYGNYFDVSPNALDDDDDAAATLPLLSLMSMLLLYAAVFGAVA